MDSVDGFCLHLKIRLRQLSDFEFPNTLETIKKVFLMAAEDSWKPLIKTINHKFRKWCLICQPWNLSNLWYQKDSKKIQFFPRKTHKLIHFWPNWDLFWTNCQFFVQLSTSFQRYKELERHSMHYAESPDVLWIKNDSFLMGDAQGCSGTLERWRQAMDGKKNST